MSELRKLGVGVIGAHAWAEKAHLPGYAAHPQARLVAICDLVPERAEAMARQFGVERVYTDPQDLINDPDVEMVDVCTPTDTHLPLSLAAIAAGKHVLSEKPLARDAEMLRSNCQAPRVQPSARVRVQSATECVRGRCWRSRLPPTTFEPQQAQRIRGDKRRRASIGQNCHPQIRPTEQGRHQKNRF